MLRFNRRTQRFKDEQHGFAGSLANLTKKYAAVLDLANLPEPPRSFRDKETVTN